MALRAGKLALLFMAYTRAQLIDLVQRTALQYGIDPGIAVAQIQAESNFNPNARSGAGAQGIAQFMPGTWATWGSGSPFDPDAAMQAWGRYFSHILRMYGWDYGYALAGYNWGENRRTLRNGYDAGRDVLSLNLPSETRGYVTKILGSSAAAIPTNGTDATSHYNQPEGSGLFLPLVIGAVLLLFVFSD